MGRGVDRRGLFMGTPGYPLPIVPVFTEKVRDISQDTPDGILRRRAKMEPMKLDTRIEELESKVAPDSSASYLD